MQENPQLHRSIVYKLQQMLYQYNSLVINLRQLVLCPNVHECRVIIKERPISQPLYTLFSASPVATINVGVYVESMEHGRNIHVVRHVVNLSKV